MVLNLIQGTQAYLGIGVLLAGYTIYTLWRAYNSPLSHVPGPWYTRCTEAVVDYYWLKGEQAKYVHRLHQKYGPTVRIGPNRLDTTDLAAKKRIYAVKEAYDKSPWYTRLSPPGLLNVFNTTDVDYHRRHRRLLGGSMSESSLKTLGPFVMVKVDLCIQRLGEEMEKRGAVDVFKWFTFFASDVIGELSCGEPFGMLEQGKETDFILNVQSVGRVQSYRLVLPWLMALGKKVPFIPLFSHAATVGPMIMMHGMNALKRYEDQVKADPESTRPSLFTKMILAKDEDKLTSHEMNMEAQLFIVAGADTTTVTLTYLVWRLAGEPKSRDKLVEELRALPKEFSYDDVHALPFLNMAIEETLRLHGPAQNALPRLVPVGGAELGGYKIPGGTEVHSQAYSMHRSPAIFPDPERWDPTRWVQPTKEMKDAMIAWGGGSRICLGIHLAKMELRLAAAKFFKAYPNATRTSLEGMSDADMEAKSYLLTEPEGKRCLVKLW